MKQNEYCYEGKLLKTERNRYYSQSAETLAEAMDSGVIYFVADYKTGKINRNSMNFVIICGSAEGRPPSRR